MRIINWMISRLLYRLHVRYASANAEIHNSCQTISGQIVGEFSVNTSRHECTAQKDQ